MLYQFYKDNEIVGTKAQPNWIYLQSNGYYGLCDYDNCEGVAIDGNPYHLEGREGLSDLETISFRMITEQEYEEEIASQILENAATEEQISEAIAEGVNSID